MKILGLSFDYHDAAAALLIDDVIVAAAEEERFSRNKHDASYPAKAIAFCLEQGGITASELDAVVFYEKPLLKFERLLANAARAFPRSLPFLKGAVESWFRQGKFDVRPRITADLGIDPGKIHLISHHMSHAAASFFSSPFEQATVVTLDGVGEFDTATISLADRSGLRVLHRYTYPHSIGLLYSAITAFLGFEVNEGEYKVMGMAGFGQPTSVDKIRRLIHHGQGRFKIDLSYFNFFNPTDSFASPKLYELLGEPRAPESPFDIGDRSQPAEPGSVQALSRHYADIAASLQQVVEEVILDVAGDAIRRTGVKNLVLGGGVSLNSMANGRILRELRVPLYIHPAAGDAGGALGAALYHRVVERGLSRPKPLTSAYLGKAYGDDAIRKALKQAAVSSVTEIGDEAAFFARVAALLQEGKVVGWHQGRFEWGPRALGARSILANPCLPTMQRTINEKIKFREPFRPFAPAILSEKATDYFEMEPPRDSSQPENFMLAVHRVRPDKRAVIPAVTHADGTARVQLLFPQSGSRFRRLVEEFDRLTGVPVLLNTSFNRRGEPIVSSPEDALQTFLWSGLDVLVMSNFIIGKE